MDGLLPIHVCMQNHYENDRLAKENEILRKENEYLLQQLEKYKRMMDKNYVLVDASTQASIHTGYFHDQVRLDSRF